MPEKSLFWSTTGTGDGTSGGYTETQLRDTWKGAISSGVLSGLNTIFTGASNNVTVSSGYASVGGYLYENDATASINVSTLANGTYGIYLIANETSAAITVSRSVSGTTVAAKTVRLALNLTTPTGTYIQIGSATVSSGQITAATSLTYINDRLANNRGLPLSVFLKMIRTSLGIGSQNIANATDVTLTFDPTASFGSTNYFTYDPTAGTFTPNLPGMYLCQLRVKWDNNTTGIRRLFSTADNATQLTAASFITTDHLWQQHSEIIQVDALAGYTSISFKARQNSTATRTISDSELTIVRL